MPIQIFYPLIRLLSILIVLSISVPYICKKMFLFAQDLSSCVIGAKNLFVSLGTVFRALSVSVPYTFQNTVEQLEWLEQLWNHENMFKTGVVRVNECLSYR